MLPDKVSHGGTYAGNRVAAAAAVEDARDPPRHRRARRRSTRPAGAIQDGLARGPQPDRPRRTTSPATRRCSGSCSRERGRDRVPRLGEHRPRAVRRDRDRHARPRRDARARLAASRGSSARRTPQGDIVDRVVYGRSSDSLDAAARGPRARRRRRRRRTAAMASPGRGLSREARASGRWSSTGTPSARSIGRRRCCWPSGRVQGEAGVTELARRLGLHKSTASRLLATLQKRGLVEQDDETGKYRLGPRRHPPRRARRADARPARDRDARARAARAR